MADEDASDNIKMFIGQISRTVDEDELRSMLEEYGPVLSLNILKDRTSGQSKGCAFALFARQKDAHAAQTALNNIKLMPGMTHPIQMKPAEGQVFTFEERKVFVGMLSKNLSESDVSTMFAPFGQIEDCSVLKDNDGNSKGCAFISFSSRQGALNAIKSLHHSQTLKGCRAPLVVKFADTQKDKESRKNPGRNFTGGMGGAGMNYGGGGSGGFGNSNFGMMHQQQNMQSQFQQPQPSFGSNNAAMNPFAAMLGNTGGCVNPLQQLLAATASAAPLLAANPALATLFAAIVSNTAGVANNNNNSGGQGNNFSMLQQQQGFGAAASAFGAQQSSIGSGNGMNQSMQMQDNSSNMSTNQNNPSSPQSNSYNASSVPGFVPGGVMNAGNTAVNNSSGGGSISTSSIPLPQYGPYGNKLPDTGSGNQSSMSGWSGGSEYFGQGAATGGGVSGDMLTKAYTGFQQFLTSMTGNNSVDISAIAGSQEEGPEGANLFIYHLPQEFRDHDLIQMFLPFGKIVSGKVFIDKVTGSSKCFGFISYDDPQSAQTAIQAMNGSNLGSRRLKVAIKTSKADRKPY